MYLTPEPNDECPKCLKWYPERVESWKGDLMWKFEEIGKYTRYTYKCRRCMREWNSIRYTLQEEEIDRQ
jgi:hypothetical protein